MFKPNLPLVSYFGKQLRNAISAQELLALPLFILMRDGLVSTHLGHSQFSGLASLGQPAAGRAEWRLDALCCGVGFLGGPYGCGGPVFLPEPEARGSPRHLAVGSLAGAGTLGGLIPPLMIMILYGVAAQQSILELFMAGVIQGLLLSVFFCATSQQLM